LRLDGAGLDVGFDFSRVESVVPTNARVGKLTSIAKIAHGSRRHIHPAGHIRHFPVEFSFRFHSCGTFYGIRGIHARKKGKSGK